MKTNNFTTVSGRERRFHRYDPRGDFSKPGEIGLISNETDYDYGTASLTRNENVTLVASNSYKDLVLIRFKWRPQDGTEQDGSKLVCLTTKFQLKLGKDFYEHNETLTYAPAESVLRPGRITQYGSPSSSLKMFIAAPYRRVRLVFSGQMTNIQSGTQCFVKARFIVSPISDVFDFFTDIRGKMDPKKSIGCAHDRHEQLIQLMGEYSIHANRDETGGLAKVKLCVFGFHARQFLDSLTQSIKTKRIIASGINGQVFHVGQISNDKKHVEFGYALFNPKAGAEQIDKIGGINWAQIGKETLGFKLEISAQGLSVVCTATKMSGPPVNYFLIEFNGKTGWALIEIDDASDSLEELTAIEDSVSRYRRDLREGKICQIPREVSGVKPLIVDIEDSACMCTELVGAKASSLAQLRAISPNLGYGVPHAVVLTRHAYDLILDENSSIKESADELESKIASGSSLAEIQTVCRALQKLTEDADLPEQLHTELASHLLSSEHFRQSGTYAVRSSSWGEDEEDMSAAGQLSTMLGVKGIDNISKAVMKCLASKFSLENVEYKRQHGLRPSLPMAVVVQEMVFCEKAGVLFTCDPTNGDNTLLTITANYGLGESVVSGQADPDTVQVRVGSDKKARVIKVDVGQKKIIMDNETLRGGASLYYDRTKCCLNEDEILRLAECGLSLAYYFQGPRDIEWGYKDGDLFIFQSRPVTGLDNLTEFELEHEADEPSSAEAGFCTRANVGEVMPFAQTPLTLTFPARLWFINSAQIRQSLGLPAKVRVHAEELASISYHRLLELRNSTFFGLIAPDGSKSIFAKAAEIGLFGHEVDDQPEIIEASRGYAKIKSPFEGFRYTLYTLGLRLMPITKLMRTRRDIRKLRDKIRSQHRSLLAEDQLLLSIYSQLAGLSRYFGTVGSNHMNIVMLTNYGSMVLIAILSKYITNPLQLFVAMTKLFATSSNVISGEIPKRIETMAQIIKSEGEGERFAGMTTDEALGYIEKDEKLSKEYKNFIELFGHRSYNEFELIAQTWREDQASVIEMLQRNCKAPKVDSSKSDDQKPKTLGQVIDSLGISNMSLMDKILLKHIFGPRSRKLVAARELSKDSLITVIDMMREVSRTLARELRKSLRLPDEDLMYYLFLDELDLLVRSPCPSLVIQATRRRNAFKKLFKEPWIFDDIIPGPYCLPNHLKPSQDLDETLMSAPQLHGTPASSGRVQAKVCLINGFAELNKVRAGDILVTHSTDIAFSPVFPLISGIVTQVGGLISHGAVVAREYGLPSLLGVPDVTRILQDGEEIVLDADKGTMYRLSVAQKAKANGFSANGSKAE